MKASLNHIFRTIWSDALNTWVAVSELCGTGGKRSGSSTAQAVPMAVVPITTGPLAAILRMRFKPVAIILACCFSLYTQANPLGAQVVNGTVGFSRSGNVLNVTNTPNAIINWQSFSIGSGETTNFIQQSASSAVLNRVVGPDPSVLLGTMTSNGRVFLINPSGILVGQGAIINVPGFVASTLNLSDGNFIAGKLDFDLTPHAGSVRNDGAITTPEGGSVYLIAPQVENNGIINTPGGETILAAGDTVQIMDTGTPGVSVQVTGSGNSATNLGKILADSGRIGMVGAMLKNSGTLNANSMVRQGGKVFLRASSRVETNGAISANGITGGTVEILGTEVGVLDGATVSANGTQGGGTVLVGGDFQGKNAAVQNARATYVAPTANISADATDNGNGGKVIVWADDTTRYYGNIFARGGANGGNGGSVETSGHNYLDFQGYVNLHALHGVDGNLLLDPADLTISNNIDSYTPGTFAGGIFSGASTPSNISWATINALLNNGSVTIQTSPGTGGSGNINIAVGTNLTGNNFLALLANGNIDFASGATVSAAGEVDLVAGWNNTGWAVTQGTGNITFNAGSMLSSASNINMYSGAALVITDASITANGNMAVNVGTDLTLTAQSSWTTLKAAGTQNIHFTGGAGIAHTMKLLGGTGTSASANANIESMGLQTIYYDTGDTLGITLAGGSTNNNVNTAFVSVNGVQTSTVICNSCATFNSAGIRSNGGQNISATTINVTAGSGGNGNNANIENRSTSVAQNIVSTGAITLTGGASGGYYNAAFPDDSVANDANIHSLGTQTISAGSISMNGGGSATSLGGAFLTGVVSQNITTSGNFSMTGGASSAIAQYGMGSPVVVGEKNGANITLNIGGTLSMAGGAGTNNPALIGSAQGTPTISISAAGIALNGDSRIGALMGGPGGTLSMTATGAITQAATGKVNTSSLTASSGTGMALNGANGISSLNATNTGGGDITLTNTASTLTINGLSNSAGNVLIDNSGAVVVAGAMSSSGAFNLTAHSPITVNMNASITATGALTLTAGSANSPVAADIITINGTISGSTVTLAGNSVTGNIPAGAVLKIGASQAAIGAVTTAVIVAAPPVFVPPPPTVGGGGSGSTTGVLPPLGAGIGGTEGTFGGSDSGSGGAGSGGTGESGGQLDNSKDNKSDGANSNGKKGKQSAKPEKC